MRIVLIVLLVILALIMVAAVLAYNTWGVWGLVGLFATVVVGLFALKFLIQRMATSFFLTPFKMKGKVLRGARIEVHAVTPTEQPDREDEQNEVVDDDDFDSLEEAEEYRREIEEERRAAAEAFARRKWYLVDVTVTPEDQPQDGFRHWEPGDLAIVSPTSDARAAFDSGDDDTVGEIEDVLIWDGGEQAYVPDDQGKYFGPQRLQLHVGVEPGNDRFAFRYYFEQFGEVRLPRK